MSYKTWSLYDETTGAFLGRGIIGPDEAHLQRNLEAGVAAMEGEHDHLSKRVDLATGTVVEWQPDSPGPDYTWDATTLRWVVAPDVAAKDAARQATMATINSLEATSLRAIREALISLGVTGRIVDTDAKISALRGNLR